ncbi:hypothetical protein FGIG_10694 [Fasciola gigantica]|uniref:Thioredoxin domain-containing protein 17 n=1 Tax=Fasciola gigantica TaxID=46835 RepID=A0A504YGQ6_FASGI|nr:hypothetical protein FGIG_10694 [Fasciola gigantica]
MAPSNLLIITLLWTATYAENVIDAGGAVIPTPVKTKRELIDAIARNEGKRIFILFKGTPENGIQWCSDCRNAQPFIDDALRQLPSDCVFLTVHVGNLVEWKNADNEFRNIPDLNVDSVPTLVDYSRRRILNLEQNPNTQRIVSFFHGS